MKTTFQYQVNDGLVHVTIGKWDTIPTGPWSSIKTKILSYSTTPILTKAQVRWYEISQYGPGLRIEKKSFTKRQCFDKPPATPLDWWSLAATHPKSNGIGYMLDPHNPDCPRFNVTVSRLYKLPVADVEAILEGIEAIAGPCPLIDRGLAVIEGLKTKQATVGSEAAEKAKATRAAAKIGGNPRKIMEGDIVVPTYPMSFKSGVTITKFYYVKGHNDTEPHFYARIDEDGMGVGMRYRATKKYLRRVCPNAFKEVTYLSSHDQLALMQEQAQRRSLVDA